jgi:ABC-type multidrug transport system ATPase subunit/ABC-type polysaccharide/polyol phosphate export permease
MDKRVSGSLNESGARVINDSVIDASVIDASIPAAVRALTKIYGAITAVDQISFTLKPATTVALVGGNGAGKTTTIAMLLGLVMPSSGEVKVFGAEMSGNRGLVAHRLNFQSPYVDLPARLTVKENLTVYAGLYCIANAAERIAYIAEDLQIKPLLDRPNGKLSAGQKTRVGLAKALLNAPELLLLDEPTASLDPDTADWIRRKLKYYAHARGATLLVASHNMAEVERLADRVILLHAGRILEDETPARLIEIYGRGTLEDVFLDVVRTRGKQAPKRPEKVLAPERKESVKRLGETIASGVEPVLLPPTGFYPSLRRIGALVERYIYLLRSSGVRLVEFVYWPFLQMLTWGFLQKYLALTTSALAQAAGALIGSVLLWEILFGSKLGFSTAFVEEVWSRNLGNLLTSPLRPYEFVAALSLWSVIRLVSMIPVAIAASVIFGFNLLDLGLPLVAFFAVLVLTSWSLGLISAGVILRYGLGAEGLAWSLPILLLPICSVFYPVSVLPNWLQPVALALPPTHVFEGMRSILLNGTFDATDLWWAISLNAVYLLMGYVTFGWFLASARVNGTLLQLGE